MKKLYKFTGRNGEAYNGYKWPLPTKRGNRWTPGDWTTPIIGELEECKNGYHLVDVNHVFDWMSQEMYFAEYRGEIKSSIDEDKYVVRQARLLKPVEKYNDKNLRLFAVWCARNALALINEPDERSVNAVNVAERFAFGKASADELAAARAVARDVAWDVVWAVAWDVAWAAARAVAREAREAREAQLKHFKKMFGL